MNSHLNSTASLLRGIPLRSIPRRRERRVSPRLDRIQPLPPILRVSPRLDWMLQVPAIYQRELDLHTNHLITLTTVTDVLV
tara:strand:- start:27 stop:269 length:243 start_codon:yes stop_codon:yes gene_type:complete